MTPERYQQIIGLARAARERQPAQRAAFLAQACAQDAELRRAVESHLLHAEQAERFLEDNALELLARAMAEEQPKHRALHATEPLPDSRAPQLAPGVTLDGRYVIARPLGQGGIGAVFLAHDQRLHNAPVVVKVLREELHTDEHRAWFVKKFRQEIAALARLDHPGVVRALDTGLLPDGHAYLVMQYIAGVALRTLIQPQGMALTRAARLLRQITQALAAAHAKGIIHRDLKPENIMAQTIGAEEHAMLIDFGIATVLGAAEEAGIKTTVVVGTPAYMAPEQLQGKPTAASDVFTLGVVAYEMLTGRLPFGADSPPQLFELQRAGVSIKPRALRPDLPAAAEAVILRALSFDQRDRYPNAKEFGAALEQAFPAEAKDVPPPELELAHVLFTDLVGYSKLTTDEQKRLLQQFQQVVSATASFQQAQANRRLLRLPTGDGVALVFFDDPLAPVRCAVEIAHALKAHPAIKLRMGIHTGPVQRFADINQNLNIAGGGINLAQRVMDCGDAGHILLSKTVADVLGQLSEWAGQLQDWGEHQVKHGVRVHLFNLYTGAAGNPALPTKLRPVTPSRLRVKRAPLLLLATLLAAAGIGAFRYATESRRQPEPPSTAPATIAERQLNYSLKVKRNPKLHPGVKTFDLAGGEFIFGADDQVRLNVSSPQSGYLYVINEGPAQTNGLPDFNVLFPVMTINGGSAEISAHQPIQIPPPSGKPEQDWFVFDREEGVEKIWLIWSERSVEEMEAIKGWANPRDKGIISDPNQIRSVAQYLTTQAATKLVTEKDEVNKQTKLKGKGAVLVSVVKLEHH